MEDVLVRKPLETEAAQTCDMLDLMASDSEIGAAVLVIQNRLVELAPRRATEPERAVATIDVLAFAEEIYRLRQRRSVMLGAALFADPAWDILLDLFIQAARGRRVAVTAACAAAGVPETTALRYVVALEAAGHIERKPDTTDARRTWLALTVPTSARIEELLSASIQTLLPHAARPRSSTSAQRS